MPIFGLDNPSLPLLVYSPTFSGDTLEEVCLRYGKPNGDPEPWAAVRTYIGPYAVVEDVNGNRHPDVADAVSRGPVVAATTALGELATPNGAERLSNFLPSTTTDLGGELARLAERVRQPPWLSTQLRAGDELVQCWALHDDGWYVVVADRAELAFSVVSVGLPFGSLSLGLSDLPSTSSASP